MIVHVLVNSEPLVDAALIFQAKTELQTVSDTAL